MRALLRANAESKRTIEIDELRRHRLDLRLGPSGISRQRKAPFSLAQPGGAFVALSVTRPLLDLSHLIRGGTFGLRELIPMGLHGDLRQEADANRPGRDAL